MKKNFILPLAIALVVLVVGFLVVNAFTSPTQAPPGGNVPAPLNVSGTGQEKLGGLILNTGNAPNGLLIPFGNVGIGTASPLAELDVNGGIRVGNDATACTAANAGAMRYNAGAFEGCNGTAQGVIGGGGAIPAGTIAFFNLAACPATWTEVIAARGRYLVGLPLSGTLGGTAGTALTNIENRSVGQHHHSITDPGHTHTIHTNSKTTGITVNSAGTVAGTNAPYVQLLVCTKN